MLIRTFRLTDKFSNAFLRVFIWFSGALAVQLYLLRLALVNGLQTLWLAISATAQTGKIAYASNEERRRAMMARRAELSTRPVIREDPLKTQNRALSMFTVALMGSLLVLVLWFTGSGQPNRGGSPVVGALPKLQTPVAPTSFPTLVPTDTPIPDPLATGGSIVYSLRKNGHDNLWAYEVGQKTPIRLTNTPADDRDPVWSPDGSKIAFASHRDGNWEVYVMDVATGNISRLTYHLGYEGAPCWSPDGKYIAYEGYEDNNLDIYIIASDGSSTYRLTNNPAPDYAPAWSPDGRRVAYVSLRDGNQDIYIINLDRPVEDEAVRFTKTFDVDEDNPVWSPDGQTLSYSARINGLDMVLTKPVAQPDAEPTVIGQGRQPIWSPNGGSLLFAVDSGAKTTLISGQVGNFGVSALALSLDARVERASWSGARLPASLVSAGGASGNNTAPVAPLYKEEVHFEQAAPPYFKLAVLKGVTAPSPYLSDKVDDSFVAMRQAVVEQIGFDFLGTLKEALWAIDRLPDPGQGKQSWHYAGRAIDFDRNLVFGNPPPIEVVREDLGVNTYWRVYVRVPNELQGGQLGEPLKRLPWDFASRTSGDPQTFEQGGKTKATAPAGYYVDFTQLAEDFGWMRVPSERTWRSNYPGILYWEYNKREGLSWNDAMLQLYTQDQVNAFLKGPTPLPIPPTAPPDTPAPAKSATPIPPDQKPQ